MLVSIIIPAYNAEDTLGECLEACKTQTHPEVEIIVVDDGSSDATSQITADMGVSCLTQTNAGPAAARNHGARVAKGEILAFTDADCIPEPEWIQRLLTGFADDVAGVGGSYDIANESSLLARMIHEEIVFRHTQYHDEVDYLGSLT